MPWKQLAAAAGQGLIGTVAGLFSGHQSAKHSEKLANMGYSHDIDMWNRMNEYNHPAQQVARLTEAGLNPALMYGSGSGSAGNAGELPRYNAPTAKYDIEPVQIMSVLGQYQDMKIKQNQIKGTSLDNETKMLNNSYLRDTLIERITQSQHQTGIYQSRKESDMSQALVNRILSVFSPEELQDYIRSPEKIQGRLGHDSAAVRQKLAQLSISQESARRISQEAELKEYETSIGGLLANTKLSKEWKDFFSYVIRMIFGSIGRSTMNIKID